MGGVSALGLHPGYSLVVGLRAFDELDVQNGPVRRYMESILELC